MSAPDIYLVCDMCGEEVPEAECETLPTEEVEAWGDPPSEVAFAEDDPMVAELRQGAICLCKVCLMFCLPHITEEAEDEARA